VLAKDPPTSCFCRPSDSFFFSSLPFLVQPLRRCQSRKSEEELIEEEDGGARGVPHGFGRLPSSPFFFFFFSSPSSPISRQGIHGIGGAGDYAKSSQGARAVTDTASVARTGAAFRLCPSFFFFFFFLELRRPVTTEADSSVCREDEQGEVGTIKMPTVRAPMYGLQFFRLPPLLFFFFPLLYPFMRGAFELFRTSTTGEDRKLRWPATQVPLSGVLFFFPVSVLCLSRRLSLGRSLN